MTYSLLPSVAQSPKVADYEFDYLAISNVHYRGTVDPKAIERIRYEDAPSRARRRLARGCTAISSVRPNLQAVAFIDNAPDNLVCSTGFNVVRPAAHKLSPKRAGYGEKIVQALSAQLAMEFGRGFAVRNLFNMIRFAEAFPEEIVSALRRQLT